MALIDYIDKEKTVIAILKDYRTQEYKREKSKEDAKALKYKMTSIGSTIGREAVQGGGSKHEEMLCKLIEKKDIAEKSAQFATEYFDQLQPAFEMLTQQEQDILTDRFIDHEESGISIVMEKYNVSRSEAYNMTNSALKHLVSLIFWE